MDGWILINSVITIISLIRESSQLCAKVETLQFCAVISDLYYRKFHFSNYGEVRYNVHGKVTFEGLLKHLNSEYLSVYSII